MPYIIEVTFKLRLHFLKKSVTNVTLRSESGQVNVFFPETRPLEKPSKNKNKKNVKLFTIGEMDENGGGSHT